MAKPKKPLPRAIEYSIVVLIGLAIGKLALHLGGLQGLYITAGSVFVFVVLIQLALFVDRLVR